MSDTCEIVTVVRKDHPDGKIDINKSDMTEDDVIFEAEVEQTGPKEGTKAWLVDELKAKGVEFDESLSKAKLQELLDSQ